MSAERQRLKKVVQRLKDYQGRHSSFTTLYVPPSKNLTEVIGFVKMELAGADNIKSKANRKNVQDNLAGSQDHPHGEGDTLVWCRHWLAGSQPLF